MKSVWIPCSDYLPECGRYVPVTLENGAMFVGRVELKHGNYMWQFGKDYVMCLDVVAWLDVKPYGVE